MSATLNVRPPLGLPAGSIRGLLALQIVLIFWMLLLVTQEIPIPLNLYFLLSLVMMFFVSHGKSIARRGEGVSSPLWLPGGSIRFCEDALDAWLDERATGVHTGPNSKAAPAGALTPGSGAVGLWAPALT